MILRNTSYEKLAQRIRQQKSQVIVYGAGMIGRIIVPDIIKQYSLQNYVSCYVDVDKRKWGQRFLYNSKEYRINPPDILRNVSENTVLLISNSRYYRILSYLDNTPALENVQAYIIPVIQIYESQLEKKVFVRHFTDRSVIPKKIHYCWFGKRKMPDFLQNCIKTWQKYCPDYEIICWNEDNYDITHISYAKEAYEQQKYGFVSDAARLDILYEHGGIYLDTDVILLKSFDELLYQEAFVGVEKWGNINTGGGCGAIPRHPMIKRMLDYRKNYHFLLEDGSLNLDTNGIYETIPFIESGMRIDNSLQRIEGVTIFPSGAFHPYDYMSCETQIMRYTFSIHRFYGGWMDKNERLLRRRAQDEYQETLKRINTTEDFFNKRHQYIV